MLMHRFIVFVVCFTSACALFGQANFSAVKSGNWTDASIWKIESGRDADGIPDADDNIYATDVSLRVMASVAVNNFTLKSDHDHQSINITNGNLTVHGNFTLACSSDDDNLSTLTLASGSIIVYGDFIYDNPDNSDKGGIIINNEGQFEGIKKSIVLHGNMNPNLSNKMHIKILGEEKGSYELLIAGGKTQEIIGTDNDIDYSKIIVDNGSTLRFYGKDDAPKVYDSLIVKNGTILLDKVSLDDIKEFENQIVVHSGSKIVVVDDIHFPDHKVDDGFATNMHAGSIVEFNIGEDFKVEILKEDFNYRNVVLSGDGIKVLKNEIGGDEKDAVVHTITIEGGTLILDDKVKDISHISGALVIKSGATLEIEGDVKMPDASKITLEEGSSLLYSGDNDQTILGGMTYTKLALAGKGKKIINDPITITKELSFDSDVKTLNLENDILLKSDASGTAFISEMPKDLTITYGGGKFICEHYFISSPIDNNNASENYRDYALPLIAGEAILSQFDDDNPATYGFANGKFTNLVEFPIFGVPGSKYPNVQKSNVSEFNSSTGLFETPSSYTKSIVQTRNGKVSSNAVRFSWADTDGLTVRVKGEINVGDITFNAQKSANGNSFNFYGNPYPCAIDFKKLVAGNSSFTNLSNRIKPVFYVIAPDLLGVNNAGFYNAFTNVGTVPKDIPAYQGFFLQVESINSSNHDFIIKENMKSSLDLTTYKSNKSEEKPELFTAKVYENGIVKDQIHFYFFEGGTNTFDPVLDVKKLDASPIALKGAKLDFFDGKYALNLLANAISNTSEMNMLFTVSNPDANSIEIELSNLSALLDVYHCVYVENIRTGDVYRITGNFLSIPAGNTLEETFAIKSVNAPELIAISSKDASCFGEEDGLLSVDMTNLPLNSSISVSKNNVEMDSFRSTKSIYERVVGAGKYEVNVSGISDICTYTFREIIKESPKVAADFDISDSLYTNTEIVFTSKAQNTRVNEWLTSEEKTVFGDNISMSYAMPGRYWMKLTALGTYESCRDEKLKYFDIEASESNVGVSEDNSFFKTVTTSTHDRSIVVNNTPSQSLVELFSMEGKLIKSRIENNGEVKFSSLNNGTYIVRISNENHAISYQIGIVQ